MKVASAPRGPGPAMKTTAGGRLPMPGLERQRVSEGRPRQTRVLVILAALVMLAMAVAIVCMYRVIGGLHEEQRLMHERMRQVELGYAQRTGIALPHVASARAEALAREAAAADGFSSSAEEAREFLAQETASQREEPYDRRANSVSWHGQDGSRGRIERRDGVESGKSEDPRRLSAMFKVGTSGDVGCFVIPNSATPTIDVSGQNCNSNYCPDCFILDDTNTEATTTLTIQKCSTAHWIRSSTRSGVWVYTFVNKRDSAMLKVQDSSGSTTVFEVPGQTFVQAYCSSASGTADRLAFHTRNLPSLTVNSGFTMEAGNFLLSGTGTFTTNSGTNTLSGDTVISNTKTFTTGTGGAITLNGATTISDSYDFKVGATYASGGVSYFNGHVVIGDSAAAGRTRDLTLNGNFAQNDDPASPVVAKTFTTATGQITLNGDVAVATGKNVVMAAAGGGAFTTGTGAVTLNGDTTINTARTFTSGAGAVTLRGDTTISAAKTFTVGTAASAGATTLYGATTIGGSATGQTKSLTLYGPFTQHDDAGTLGQAPVSTFTTGSGTHTLNGDINGGTNKNWAQSGTGTFTTGSGAVTLGGDTTISGAKTFTSGTGANTFNGVTTISNNANFNVGTAGGTGSLASFFGNVIIGGAATTQVRDLTLRGSFKQMDDPVGSEPDVTFTTGVGRITLNGDVHIATGKNLVMDASGDGIFTTGTGAVSLNGAMNTIAQDVTINGVLTANGNVNLGNGADTINVGSATGDSVVIKGTVSATTNPDMNFGTGTVTTGGTLHIAGGVTAAGSADVDFTGSTGNCKGNGFNGFSCGR
eukprot:TRINITY_DN54097_c0_g1_i1.p1 TRINITY_DN54097_c0_g1~~TRINITY_DN54097_c0_g1_i1.p1  ORF type:complete len:816 (-),score=165.15 TRINITY_DN54097_c0_g1_i1:95-2542(-)